MRLVVPAEVDRLDQVMQFIAVVLEKHNCPAAVETYLTMAVEEVFVNIVNYAYDEGVGDVTLDADVCEQAVTIRVTDCGKAYNPMEKSDPDITLAAEKRQIGGLGIYMVKKLMDEVSYAYADGKNCLTIIKRW
ncbi:MAG: ATP-binding protein [Clostridia bacterium]